MTLREDEIDVMRTVDLKPHAPRPNVAANRVARRWSPTQLHPASQRLLVVPVGGVRCGGLGRPPNSRVPARRYLSYPPRSQSPGGPKNSIPTSIHPEGRRPRRCGDGHSR